MNAIYVYDGEFQTGDAGFPMIKTAAARHCLELNQAFDFSKVKVVRDEKGKPYFEDFPMEFSLTHSGALWMCMFSDRPCGLDLQVMQKCNFEKLAERYFLPDEVEYVKEHGQEGFFWIWVRKEAYCKMTGAGLFGAAMPSVVADSGEFEGVRYHFTDVEISDDMKCAYCTPEEAEAQLRILA